MALVGDGWDHYPGCIYLVGSIVVPESAANQGDLYNRLKGPMAVHIFGTDSTGRDVFDRIIYGGQISLMIGILAVCPGGHNRYGHWWYGRFLWRLGGCNPHALYRGHVVDPVAVPADRLGQIPWP